jgi:hypothetical protein
VENLRHVPLAATPIAVDRCTRAFSADRNLTVIVHLAVPLRGTDCGQAAALSATVTDPVRVPVLIVNRTVMVHHATTKASQQSWWSQPDPAVSSVSSTRFERQVQGGTDW